MSNDNSGKTILTRDIPFLKSVAYVAVLVSLCGMLFFYGVIVGLYQAPPWNLIKSLVGADDAAIELASQVPTTVVAHSPESRLPETPLSQLSSPVLPGLLYSTLLNLNITWVNPGRPINGPGGGISHFDGKILISRDMEGSVWIFDEAQDTYFQSGIFLPDNNLATSGIPTAGHSPRTYPPRYSNVLVGEDETGDYILAIYGHNNAEQHCRTQRVAMTRLPENWSRPVTVAFPLKWQLIFETTPCFSFAEGAIPIAGYQEGGFLVRESGGDYLFSTGDLGQEGSPARPHIVTQPTPETRYGRVFRISSKTFEYKEVAVGVRNPQGAVRDDAGRVWFVDQGPMGGDEINLVTKDANYGWPYVTYGVQYTLIEQDTRMWFHSEVLGRHDGYVKPKHTFVPSVSPSDITFIKDFHPNWDGDLLVTTLLGASIIRLIREGDDILGQEVMSFGERMRSILMANGRIYFMTDRGVLGYLTPRSTAVAKGGPNPALAVLEKAGCIECHSKVVVPALTRIYGTPIASQAGVIYSAALRQRKETWTDENLRAFLMDTNTFAPGTAMPPTAMAAEDIDKVITALGELAKE
ncbi:MAG: cytochrome c2 [Granulosicoccus sp.]|jgi:cytochrome c2